MEQKTYITQHDEKESKKLLTLFLKLLDNKTRITNVEYHKLFNSKLDYYYWNITVHTEDNANIS